jgi:hypothetical protein
VRTSIQQLNWRGPATALLASDLVAESSLPSTNNVPSELLNGFSVPLVVMGSYLHVMQFAWILGWKRVGSKQLVNYIAEFRHAACRVTTGVRIAE